MRLRRLSVLVFLLGCADNIETDLREGAITQEQPGDADIVGDPIGCPAQWCGYLEDPSITLNSYATVRYDTELNCTASLIGPNVAIGAAHCGPQLGNMWHYLYRSDSRTPTMVQKVQCDFLTQSISLGDTMIAYCPDIELANGNRVPPGLLFGYLDFDPRPVAEGEALYKLWWNPVLQPPALVTPNGLGHLLYSAGNVTENAVINGADWLYSDVCISPGASGSVSLDSSSHRIIAGPLATGWGDPNSCGSPSNSASAWSLFNEWRINTIASPNQFNPGLLSQLGLAPSQYNGLQDKDRDDVFDVQEDLEALTGEVKRDHYWLGFGNRRRNALWERHTPTNVTWDPSQNRITVWNVGNTFNELITHRKLNLASDTTFRGNVRIRRNSTFLGGEIELQLIESATGSVVSTASIEPAPTGDWITRSFQLRSSHTGEYRLALRAQGTFSFQMSSLNLIEEGSIMDFDTYDKRKTWLRDDGARPAFMLPEGRSVDPDSGRAGSALPGFSFAGLVTGSGEPATTHWTLQNYNLALNKDTTYRLCFHAKLYDGGAGTVQARVRDSGSGTVFASINAPVSTTWQPHCLPYATPTGGNNVVEFGIVSPESPVLIDDLTLVRLEPTDGNLIAVGDVDSDGESELITGYNSITDNAAMYISDSGYPTGARMYGPESSFAITAMAVGDVDGNGINEIYTAFNRHDGHASIYRSEDPSRIGTLIYGPNPYWNITALAVGDVDGDGDAELITAFNGHDGVAAIYQSDTGFDTGPRIYGFAPNSYISALAIADLVIDSVPELYFASTSLNGSTTLWMKTGVSSPASVYGPLPDTIITALTVGNLDGSLFKSLFVGENSGSGGKIVRLSYPLINSWTTSTAYGPDPNWLVSSLSAGDVDSDGRDELFSGFNHPSVGARMFRLDDSTTGPGVEVWSSTYWRN